MSSVRVIRVSPSPPTRPQLGIGADVGCGDRRHEQGQAGEGEDGGGAHGAKTTDRCIGRVLLVGARVSRLAGVGVAEWSVPADGGKSTFE